jgi:hypothetical protein
MDVFFLITIFSVSVAAAARESQIRHSNSVSLHLLVNKGAFASAAVCIYSDIHKAFFLLGLVRSKYENIYEYFLASYSVIFFHYMFL